MKIYPFLFTLHSQVGHAYQYHVSVKRALEASGWNYIPVVPRNIQSLQIPSDWKAILFPDPWEVRKGFLKRLKIFWGNLRSLLPFLKDLRMQEDCSIFLESFELQHLASLFTALFFLKKPRFGFCILHRFAYSPSSYRMFFYKLFHWMLEKKLGRSKVFYLTDSELLARELCKIFGKKFSVVPIPHGKENRERIVQKNEKKYLWWPGGSVRPDKGLGRIGSIVSELAKDSKWQLVIAEKAASLFGACEQIRYIPTHLSREEYLDWMQRSDILILPYSSEEYAHRTSGIFVEAVGQNKFVLVSQGTWMAHELQKFDLGELIIDWNQGDILQWINRIEISRVAIEAKIGKMGDHYRSFHSEENFKNTFLNLMEPHR